MILFLITVSLAALRAKKGLSFNSKQRKLTSNQHSREGAGSRLLEQSIGMLFNFVDVDLPSQCCLTMQDDTDIRGLTSRFNDE